MFVWLGSSEGTAAIEYALVLALVVGALAVGLTTLGAALNTKLQAVLTNLGLSGSGSGK